MMVVVMVALQPTSESLFLESSLGFLSISREAKKLGKASKKKSKME